MGSLYRLCTIALSCVFAVFVQSTAQTPKEFTVRVTATVRDVPQPQITLTWDAHPDQKGVIIHRKLKSASSFTGDPIVTLDSITTSWTDTSVQIGQSYEYRLIRDIIQRAGTDPGSGQPTYRRFWGFGYINSGIKVVPEMRGRVLVLVDTSFVAALSSELQQYEADLIAEGWMVTLRTVPRAEAFSAEAVSRVRTIISEELAANRRDIKAILLVGRVPVPYSGLIAPDGHQDHGGAWPADGIYGDEGSSYTDQTANFPNTQRPAQNNVPNDGKFDQSTFPTPVEIAVGRVDFFNLPEFAATELELLKAYFKKNHEFRAGITKVQTGGIIDDNFGSYGEGFASSAWRNFPLFGGDTAVKAADWFESLSGPTTYLWAYGCGAGTNTSCNGVCTTAELATKPVHAIHTQLFGSYFGDWDTRNNLLRAAIATSPRALTCAWVGRPAWYMHHMALGETIGYSLLISQNNSSIVAGQLGTYAPNVVYSGQGASIATIGERSVHIALIGDPTLRAFMEPVPPVLTVTSTTEFPNLVHVTWQNVPGADGYMVARKIGNLSWQMRTQQPITLTQYRDSLSYEGTIQYRIYPCVLRSSASGTWYDIGRPGLTSVVTTHVENSTAPESQGLHVWPQPASNIASLRLDLTEHLHNTTLTVYDLAGGVVWEEAIGDLGAGQHSLTVPVHRFSSGSYLISLRSSAATLTTRFTVVR